MTSPVPILLVHGFASSFERNWREPGWVDILADEGRDVIGLDLLGHGQAAKPHDPSAYAHIDQDVVAALPEQGVVDAVGFSMGAQLLLQVAAERPDRIRRLVLGGIGDSIFRGHDSEAVARAVEAGQPDEGDPASAQAFSRFARAPGNDPAALAACLRRPRSPIDEKALANVKVPALIVIGGLDEAGPADRLVAALPDAQLVTLPGVDHFGTPKDFRFIEAAVTFLK